MGPENRSFMTWRNIWGTLTGSRWQQLWDWYYQQRNRLVVMRRLQVGIQLGMVMIAEDVTKLRFGYNTTINHPQASRLRCTCLAGQKGVRWMMSATLNSTKYMPWRKHQRTIDLMSGVQNLWQNARLLVCHLCCARPKLFYSDQAFLLLVSHFDHSHFLPSQRLKTEIAPGSQKTK